MSKRSDTITLSLAEANEILKGQELAAAQCELHNRGYHHTIPDLTMKEIRHSLALMAAKVGARANVPIRAEEEKSQALSTST